jgi:hypothetical protein
MISGNGVPAASERDEGVHWGKQSGDESQPLRVIQNLIAKLEVVNRQLSFPLRARPAPWPEETGVPEAEQS